LIYHTFAKKYNLRFHIILSIIFLTQLTYLHAQEDSYKGEEDVSIYFNDSGYSKRKNLIKVNLLALVQGDLPISLERVITKGISIEAGVGVMLPYYTPNLFELLIPDERTIKNPDLGFSFMVQPKFYIIYKEAPEYSYVGVLYRKRFFSQNNQKINFDEIAITYGFNLFLGKSNTVLFAYETGLGLRITTNKTTDRKTYLPCFPLNFKLGYIF
jgi:hypothetical protein